MSKPDGHKVPPFTELNELSSVRNGGRILFATDDWFAEAERMLLEEEPTFKEDLYTDFGKWMDGWETRRKRTPGHDWCIIRLGAPGVLHGLELNTLHFTGNYAPRYSLQGANLTDKEEQLIPPRCSQPIGTASSKQMDNQMKLLHSDSWTEIVPMTKLRPGYPDTCHNYHEISSGKVWTHLRLNIYPDGGVARLRVFGETRPLHTHLDNKQTIDLVAMNNGGICKGYSNAHYGHPRNLIRPGLGLNMGDGWETARRLDRPAVLEVDDTGILQVAGSEWAIFRLGHIGLISHLDIDTKHFKGNYPDSVRIDGALMKPTRKWNSRTMVHTNWKCILPTSKLSADKVHTYFEDLLSRGPFSHVRITIAPDGGVSRLRIYGTIHAAMPQF